jgi:hypothetical protein
MPKGGLPTKKVFVEEVMLTFMEKTLVHMYNLY